MMAQKSNMTFSVSSEACHMSWTSYKNSIFPLPPHFLPESQNVNFFITPHECDKVLLKNVKTPIFTCTIKAFAFHVEPPDCWFIIKLRWLEQESKVKSTEVADVTKLTVVSSREGKQPKANVNTQQTLAQGSEVDFTLQLQKASCNTKGRARGDAEELEQEAALLERDSAGFGGGEWWNKRWKSPTDYCPVKPACSDGVRLFS